MLCDYTVFIHLTFKFSYFKPISSVFSNYGDIHLAYKLIALHKLSFTCVTFIQDSNTDTTTNIHKPKQHHLHKINKKLNMNIK